MISNADGSIVLTTTVDESGINKGTADISKKFGDLGRTLDNALKTGDTRTASLAQSLKKAEEAVEKQAEKVRELQKEYEKLAELQRLENEQERERSAGNVDRANELLGTIENLRSEMGMGNNVTEDEITRVNAKLDEENTKLNNLGNQAQIAGEKLNAGMAQSAGSIDGVAEGFSRLARRISGLVKRVFIFSVITKALRALRSALVDYIKNDEQLNKSLTSLKESLSVIGNSLMETLRPALEWLLNALAYIANVAAQLFASWLGKSAEEMKSLGKETKQTTKALAAFDEVNTLATGDDAASGGSATATSFANKTADELAMIGTVTGLAMVGLGLILALSGVNIPLGLGLIAIGGAVAWESATENWDKLSDKTKEKIETIGNLSGAALIGVGIILCCTGVGIGIGLAMIAAGGALIYGSYKLDPEKFKEKWEDIAWEIEKVWQTITNRANTSFRSLIDSITSLITHWKNKDWKGVIKDIGNIIISGVNIVLDLIQTALKGLTYALLKVVSWISKIFPDSWGWSFDISWNDVNTTIPTLNFPTLATGGVVPYATTAVIGEDGAEAVLPLENNTGWMDALADKLAARMGGNAYNIEVPVILNGREIARAQREAEQEMGKQTVFGGFANVY